MAKFVYIECFVKHKSVKELIEENPLFEVIIMNMYAVYLAEEGGDLLNS